jgi:hypothetical protein
MAIDFPLSQLTVSMMREVFRAIQDSAMEQTEAFSDVVAAASLTEDLYVAKMVGATASDQLQKAKSFVVAVVLPSMGVAADPTPDPVLFTDAGKEALLVLFEGVSVDAGDPAAGAPPDPKLIEFVITATGDPKLPWSIALDMLVAFAREKLVRDAKNSHRKLRVAVKTGMPQVAVTGGQIVTKVTMATVESGTSSVTSTAASLLGSAAAQASNLKDAAKAMGSALPVSKDTSATVKSAAAAAPALVVRVANERSAAFSRSQELIGTVKIDFRVGSFPPVTLPEA